MPTVSSDPAHAVDMRRCADWLIRRLRRVGFADAGIVPGTGHPLVRATWHKLPGRATLLVYGHYDVQPAGDASRWRTPAFEPTLAGAYLLGRGAADDKGPLLALIFALESQLRATGRLPLNVTCIFEGEEEVGSPALGRLVKQQPDLFAANAALVADTRSPGAGRPAITYALRGLLSVDLRVRTADHDLHAGHFGGALRGAADALACLISGLHDSAGRVLLPDFYTRVRPLKPTRRLDLTRTGLTNDEILRQAGAPAGWGEPGFSLFERTIIRPALTTTALDSGDTEPAGYVAAVPAAARARIDIRLVADQDPAAVLQQLRQFVASHASGLRVSLRPAVCAPPVVVDRAAPAMQAAVAACQRGFGARPELHRSGATIPVVSWLHRELHMPVVLLGLALDDDNRHAPDERVHLPTLAHGEATTVAFLDELARRVHP